MYYFFHCYFIDRLGQDHIEQQGDIQGSRSETAGNTLRYGLKGEKQSDGRPRGDDSRQADRPKGEQQSGGHPRGEVSRQANRLKGEKQASGPRRGGTVRQAGGTGCSLAVRDQNHDDGRSGSDYGCKAESKGKPPSWRQRRSKGGNRHRNRHTRSGVVRNPAGWSYYKEPVLTPRLPDRVVQNELKLGRPGAPPNTTTFIMDQHSHPHSLSAPSDDWSYEEQVDDLCFFRPSRVANEPKQGRPAAPPNSTTFIMDQHSHPYNPSALSDDWSYEERVDDLRSFRLSQVVQNECWESRPGASPNTTTFIMDQYSHTHSPSALSDDCSYEKQVDDLCSFRLSRVANEPKLGRPGAPPNSTTFIMDQYRHSYNSLTPSDEFELVWRRC